MALPPLLPACTQWSPHTRCAGIFGGRLEGGFFGGCIVKHIEDVLVRTLTLTIVYLYSLYYTCIFIL